GLSDAARPPSAEPNPAGASDSCSEFITICQLAVVCVEYFVVSQAHVFFGRQVETSRLHLALNPLFVEGRRNDEDLAIRSANQLSKLLGDHWIQWIRPALDHQPSPRFIGSA